MRKTRLKGTLWALKSLFGMMLFGIVCGVLFFSQVACAEQETPGAAADKQAKSVAPGESVEEKKTSSRGRTALRPKNAENSQATGAAAPHKNPRAELERAVLAGGCFWGMEEILRKVPGVVSTEVGYTGGHTSAPTYREVSTGKTGHAEAVEIFFDPAQLSYETLLEKYFFRMHDPTTLNRQGNDRGSQYRSVIFATSPAQAEVAERVRARVDKSELWKDPIVTEIVPAAEWTPAEDMHQDYLEKHPNGYTCHWLR